LQHHSLVDSGVPAWLTRSATAEACTCFTVLVELLNQANGATPEQEIESIAHFFRDRIVRDAGNNRGDSIAETRRYGSMITRYDPFREALSLRRAMDQLFEQSVVHPSLMPGSPTLMAPMDICETKNGYEVDIALPGVRPEDIELLVDQNTLTIRGRYSHQNEHQDQPQGQTLGQQQMQQQGQPQWEQQGKEGRHRQGHNWLSREIIAGAFERTVTFPRPIDTNNIQTKFENGILTILLPVTEESRPKRITITGGQSQPQQVPVGAGQQRG
jgi:HSP20 family protein